MTTIAIEYRLRIHDAGTLTPSDGTVAFVVSELRDLPEFGGQVVRPTEGVSRLGRWSFYAVDDAGAITAELADPTTGRAHLIGRVAEVQERRDGGSWTTANTGRLTGLEEEQDAPGTYLVEVRDERWVEGRSRVFDAADTCQLWPAGLRYRWRNRVPLEGSAGPAAFSEQIDADGSRRKVRLWSTRVLTTAVGEWIRGDLVDEPVQDRNDGSGNFTHLRLNLGGTNYQVLSFSDEVDGTDFVGSIVSEQKPVRTYIEAWIWAPSGFSGMGYFWAPTAPPSLALPLHLGTVAADGISDSGHTWGFQNPWDLVEAMYVAAGVRYDSAAFDALRALKIWHPYAPRVTDPDLTVRDLAEEIYAAHQVVPFLDDAGRVAPRSVRMPNADAVDPSTLFEFNAGNCASTPSFRHIASEVVNLITVKGKLYEFAGVYDLDGAADGNVEKEVVLGPFRYDSGTQELGDAKLELSMPGVPPRAERSYADNFLFGINLSPKLEDVVAFIRAETFDRFGDGPIRGEFVSLRTVQDGGGRTPEDVQVGDLVKLNFDTFPNLTTQTRGGVRLVQVLSKKPGPRGITWEYLDAGPNLQALATPTLSLGANSGNPRHARDATIGGVPAGARVQLRYGFGSGTDYVVTLDDVGAGVVTLQALPSGTDIRAQVRAVAPGRVRSAWSTVATSTTSPLPAPTGLSTTVLGRGMKLEWSPAASGYPLVPVFRTAGGGAWTDALRVPLPPGSAVYVFGPQAASTSYDWGVQHVDEFGGRGVIAYATASTSTARKLGTPSRVQVLQGRAAGGVDDLVPPLLRIGYGIEVGFVATEPSADVLAEVSTDSGFASIDQQVQVPPDATRVLILTGLDEVVRYIRLVHRRDGFTDSDPSDVVTSKPTALKDVDGVASDAFPGGFVSVAERAGGKLEVFIQDGGDPDTASAFVAWEKNPSPEDFPAIDTGTDRQVSPLPVRENLNQDDGDPPTEEVFSDGDVVMIQVAFADAAGGLGQRVLIRHVYGEAVTTVSVDRIRAFNPTSGGTFPLNILRVVGVLRVPGSVASWASTLKVEEWNGSGYDAEVTYTANRDGTPTLNVVEATAPTNDSTDFSFHPLDRIVSWDLVLYDATGGAAGSGVAVATVRVLEDVLVVDVGQNLTQVYSTSGDGSVIAGGALRLGASGKGAGVFNASDGLVLDLKSAFDAGNVSGSWTPDYEDGAAQVVTLTGATALQVPDNWGTGRPMTILVNCNGQALTFQASRFYGPSDGPGAGDLTGLCLISIELMATDYVVTALMPNLAEL